MDVIVFKFIVKRRKLLNYKIVWKGGIVKGGSCFASHGADSNLGFRWTCSFLTRRELTRIREMAVWKID